MLVVLLRNYDSLLVTLQIGDTSAVASLSHQPVQKVPTDDAAFADLFDNSPGQTKVASPSSRGSFSFCMPAAHSNENAEPNVVTTHFNQEISSLAESKPVPHSLLFALHGPGLVAGDKEQDTATQQALQEQHITPRRRRGGWGTPQPVPENPPGNSTQTADHIMLNGLAGTCIGIDSAKQAEQVTLEVDGAQLLCMSSANHDRDHLLEAPYHSWTATAGT